MSFMRAPVDPLLGWGYEGNKETGKIPWDPPRITAMGVGMYDMAAGLYGVFSSVWGMIPDEKQPDYTAINYVIANDGPNGLSAPMVGAGGDLPDVRLWTEAGGLAGYYYNNGKCEEGDTMCGSHVYTRKAPTYALFTGKQDPICIAYMGIRFPSSLRDYSFIPGNWAQHCEQHGNTGPKGSWYYANTDIPATVPYNSTLYCLWLNADGNTAATGLQIHWPEFDMNEAPLRSPAYYCGDDYPNTSPALNFRREDNPHKVYKWVSKPPIYERGLVEEGEEAFNQSEAEEQQQQQQHETQKRDFAPAAPFETYRRDIAPADIKSHILAKRDIDGDTKPDFLDRLAEDPVIVKSHKAQHSASKLCDRSRSALGRSFVSYAEQKFCFMPTKTLYEFCENVEAGLCWNDMENVVIIKQTPGIEMAVDADEIPDLSHVTDSFVWGDENEKPTQP